MKRLTSVAVVMVLAAGSAFAGKPGSGGGNGNSSKNSSHNNGHQNSHHNSHHKNHDNSHHNAHHNSHGSNKHGHSQSFHGYHLTHGKSFGTGWCYQGKSHSHWTYNCYCPKYCCTCYWCPSTLCYYYWCEPAGCYYPYSNLSSGKVQMAQVIPPLPK